MQGLASIRTSLEADGYAIEVTDGEVTDGEVTDGEVTDGEVTDGEVTDGEVTDGQRVTVVVSATPDACAECLVPKSVMVSILEHALKVPADRIDLAYPPDVEAHGSGGE